MITCYPSTAVQRRSLGASQLLFLVLRLVACCVVIGANVPAEENEESTDTDASVSSAQQSTTNTATNISSRVLMHNGHSIPVIGLGLALMGDASYPAVQWALSAGYRLLDTAAEETYGNEAEVGRAIHDYLTTTATTSASEVNPTMSREDVFVTTKLWDDAHGFWPTLETFEESYHALNIGTIDLYLIHSPFGGHLVETWDALLYLQSQGYVTSIGVSNFGIRHLQALATKGRPRPVVNQIELHPLVYQQRKPLLEYCRHHGILVQAYGSLMHGYPEYLSQPQFLVDMATRYHKTTAQILLKWAVQHDFLIIPKSAHQYRIVDNSRLFDFTLSAEDMTTLDSWGDHIPSDQDRNIYKEEWNWNPIDEAPVHRGRMDFWPHYEGVDEIYFADDEEEDSKEEL
jgi:diketogulonate reductase-like aldo/keto reductase